MERLWLFSSLGVLCLAQPADVKWHISIAWEDEDCNLVCGSNGLSCTEACWPFTAKGLENALQGSGLQGTCFGFDAGNPNPWHPAKDAENTMCHWFAGHTASQAPRCPHKPSTPAQLLAQSKVTRRLCPCVGANASSSFGFNCGLGDQPVDPVVPVVTDPQALTTSTTVLKSEAEDAGDENPAPAVPEVLQPPMVVCQELCVSGFGAEDEKLNGKYVRLSGSDGSLSFWLKLGGLPTGADCRLVRGALDGVWRYYEVTSKGNTSIGEGTLRAPLDDIPKDDYVLTPTGGFQVEYQCCPQQLATESPQLAVDVDPQVQEESTNTAMIAVALSGAVVLFISIVVICVIQRWKPGILRSRRYEAFPEKMTTPQQNVEKMQPNPGKVMLGNRASEITSSKAATWNSSWSPAKASAKLGGGAVEQSPAGGATLLPSAKNADRRAVAVADVLGKASTTSDDGIYEGPTRQWWGGSSSSGRGGTGFQPGARVRLQGLTASSWNGAEGIIEGWDAQKGAFEVKVNGTLKLVKPDNLVVSPAAGRAGEGDLTPAQLRMKLNAAQVNQLSQGPERSSPSAPRVEVGRQRQRAAQPGFGDTSQIHKALARPRAGERDERQLPGPSIASGSGDHLRSAGNWRSHAPAPPPR